MELDVGHDLKSGPISGCSLWQLDTLGLWMVLGSYCFEKMV